MVVLAAMAAGMAPLPATAAPKFAAVTVDARNGKVLYAENPDATRHPASLTKMMTLYVLFQDLKSGKIKLNSPIRMSKRAASMAPSKLGVKPGTSISVDTAIKALVVKSANDVAAAVAENLGGTEAEFARRMTRTARAIGMSKSNFANASGLPNLAQVTSARDMATLGLRLMRDFPQYYPYFRTQSFTYAGRTIRGHNRLLGKYDGTDGIKTGYINASGFNLVSSVRRGDKRLVGVVLGGRSGASRDTYMKQMLTKNFGKAIDGRMIAAVAGSSKGAVDPVQLAEAAPENMKKPKGSIFGRKKKQEAPAPEAEIEVAEARPAEPEQGDTDEDGAASPVTEGTTIATVDAPDEPAPTPQPEPPKIIQSGLVDPGRAPKLPFQIKSPSEQMADATSVASLPVAEASWSIQIGAYATKRDAQARLLELRKKAPDVLEGTTALTVTVQKGKDVSYRARFSGFDQDTAKAACKVIEKRKSACYVLAPAS